MIRWPPGWWGVAAAIWVAAAVVVLVAFATVDR